MTLFDTIQQNVDAEKRFAVATVVSGPSHVGMHVMIDPSGADGVELPADLHSEVVRDGMNMLSLGQSGTREFQLREDRYRVFIESYVPSSKIVIVGAVQIAQSLTRLAKELGYRVIVTDARATFATHERFPDADQILKGWPQDVLPTIRFDDTTYVVLLSHDPKFDEPTLRYVLPLAVPYVGAIGSSTTQRKRRERLQEMGIGFHDLAKLHGPVGLDLGGRSPEETALAILAEITAVRHGRTGSMLKVRVEQPIH